MLFPVQVIWLQSSIFVAFGIGFFAGFDVFVGFTGPHKISPRGRLECFLLLFLPILVKLKDFKKFGKLEKFGTHCFVEQPRYSLAKYCCGPIVVVLDISDLANGQPF